MATIVLVSLGAVATLASAIALAEWAVKKRFNLDYVVRSAT
jgi:hypothetical protein